MEVEQDAGAAEVKRDHRWRWFWVTPAIVGLMAFVSPNWRFLPGPPFSNQTAERLDDWANAALVGLAAAILGFLVAAALLAAVAAGLPRSRPSLLYAAAVLGGSAVAALALGYVGLTAMPKFAEIWVMRRARPIIGALERHHADVGRYPAGLPELVPK